MKYKIFAPALILIFGFSLAGASSAPANMQHVTVPSGSDTGQGYLYLPAGGGRFERLFGREVA